MEKGSPLSPAAFPMEVSVHMMTLQGLSTGHYSLISTFSSSYFLETQRCSLLSWPEFFFPVYIWLFFVIFFNATPKKYVAIQHFL